MTQKTATALIHHPYVAPADFEAVPPAVYKASSVFFPSVAEMHRRTWVDKSGYTYGLHPPPSRWKLAWPRWRAPNT